MFLLWLALLSRPQRAALHGEPASSITRASLRLAGFDGTINAFAQFLASLEMGHPFLGDAYLVAGLGVSPHARRPVIECKTAEAADLDTIAPGQYLRHRIEYHLDG